MTEGRETMSECVRMGWARPKCCNCGRFVPAWDFQKDWESDMWEDETWCRDGHGCKREEAVA